MDVRKSMFAVVSLLLPGIFLLGGCGEGSQQTVTQAVTKNKTVVRTVTQTVTATAAAPAPQPAPARTRTPAPASPSSEDIQAADYDSMLYVVQTHPDYDDAASYTVSYYNPEGFGNVDAYYPEIDGTIVSVYVQKDPDGYWYVTGDSLQDIP